MMHGCDIRIPDDGSGYKLTEQQKAGMAVALKEAQARKIRELKRG